MSYELVQRLRSACAQPRLGSQTHPVIDRADDNAYHCHQLRVLIEPCEQCLKEIANLSPNKVIYELMAMGGVPAAREFFVALINAAFADSSTLSTWGS